MNMTISSHEIHKLTLDASVINKVQEIMLPAHSHVVDAGWQGDDIAVWYFTTTFGKEPWYFVITFTGANLLAIDCPVTMAHLRTLQKNGLVYHVLYGR